MNVINLSESLKLLREQKGLSKAEFARLLDVKYTTYNNYELDSQAKEPRLETLVKMADILGVSLDELLGRENNIFTKVKNVVEKAGVYIVYNDLEVEIQTSGFYNNEPVNFSRSFSKDEFIKIIINLINECEKEKDRLLKEKIKLYLFDEVFGQHNK